MTALNRFVTWCALQCLRVKSEGELDDLLVEYGDALLKFRGDFSILLSAVQFWFPRTKGKLVASYMYRKGWEAITGIKHTTPMLPPFVFAVAAQMVQNGRARMGIGLLVQFEGLLRACELFPIRARDIVLPEFQPHLKTKKCFILLGFGRSTKVKRQQVAKLTNPFIIAALRYVYSMASTPEDFLFSCDYNQYTGLLTDSLQKLGLGGLGFTPHSPRSGKATQMLLDETPFKEIQEAGRWASDTSLRIYLDRAQALATDTVARSIPLLPFVHNPWKIGKIFLFRPLKQAILK
jgi:hypothetical protein